MNIVFLIHRRNYFKHLGPLIEEACRRGWQISIWLVIRDSGKTYLRPDTKSVPDLCAGAAIKEFHSDHEMITELQQSRPHVVLSLHPKSFYEGGEQIDIPWVTLQHNLDSFLKSAAHELATTDMFCFQSEFWEEFAGAYYLQSEGVSVARFKQMMSGKAHIVGTPQHDVFPQIDRDTVRTRYKIPLDRPMVLYYPINLLYWPGHWPIVFRATTRVGMLRQLVRSLPEEGIRFILKYLSWVFHAWNDRALASSVREFCDHNDAFLVSKGRRKDPFRDSTVEVSDLLFYDDESYPATSLQLIAASDLVIHFYSTAALEAAAAGVPAICVDRPNLTNPAHTLWRRHGLGDAFNFPGVNSWQTLPAFIEEFKTHSLTNYKVEEEALKRFRQSYLGVSDFRNSQIVLDAIASEFD